MRTATRNLGNVRKRPQAAIKRATWAIVYGNRDRSACVADMDQVLARGVEIPALILQPNAFMDWSNSRKPWYSRPRDATRSVPRPALSTNSSGFIVGIGRPIGHNRVLIGPPRACHHHHPG